jgi:hypothetical protein
MTVLVVRKILWTSTVCIHHSEWVPVVSWVSDSRVRGWGIWRFLENRPHPWFPKDEVAHLVFIHGCTFPCFTQNPFYQGEEGETGALASLAWRKKAVGHLTRPSLFTNTVVRNGYPEARGMSRKEVDSLVLEPVTTKNVEVTFFVVKICVTCPQPPPQL